MSLEHTGCGITGEWMQPGSTQVVHLKVWCSHAYIKMHRHTPPPIPMLSEVSKSDSITRQWENICISCDSTPLKYNKFKCVWNTMCLAESHMSSLCPIATSQALLMIMLLALFFFVVVVFSTRRLSHRESEWPHISRGKQFKSWSLYPNYPGWNPGLPSF